METNSHLETCITAITNMHRMMLPSATPVDLYGAMLVIAIDSDSSLTTEIKAAAAQAISDIILTMYEP